MVNSIISNFDITKEALPDLLLRISQGKVQIPDLQRSFCWTDDLVIQLLASVSQGWPVGSILLLEQTNDAAHDTKSGNRQFRPRPVEGTHCTNVIPTHLILDGQQRATALFMTLFSNAPVLIKDKRTRKTSRRCYYLDMAKAIDTTVDREAAIISVACRSSRTTSESTSGFSAETQYQSALFPVAQVFSYAQWRQQYSQYWNYCREKLALLDRFEQDVIKRFEHYQIPVIQLKPELPKVAVCRVFEKTNTQSTELNFFDLATACFAGADFSLRDDWIMREQRIKQHQVLQSLRDMDFLACVTLVATYTRRQQVLKTLLKQTNALPQKLPAVACGRAEVLDLSVDEYRNLAERVTIGYEAAARFLHGQKVLAAEEVPYQIQLVALAAILTVTGYPTEQARTKLAQWFWCGSCTALYTSWHEVRASKDMVEVPDWLLTDHAVPSTILEASFTPSRLLAVQRRHGAIFKSVNALLRREGAIDFATGETLADVQGFRAAIDSHHVFPIAYCKDQGILATQYNCLVNRTPLSQLSNQRIGSKAPSQYLQALVNQGIPKARLDAILRSHCIEPETLWSDDFEAFLTARTVALFELVTKAMGKELSGNWIEIHPRSSRVVVGTSAKRQRDSA
ncbi:GmrSD restriction endonuclease domain-containing protein [Leptolyngbya sp. AN03gr2]|uniref:GmrSD restriction endonuclease domain-containing protein n=1 Tax=unclassified Leptolyngbya TaxID=2650499 RepID=UPI003D324403